MLRLIRTRLKLRGSEIWCLLWFLLELKRLLLRLLRLHVWQSERRLRLRLLMLRHSGCHIGGRPEWKLGLSLRSGWLRLRLSLEWRRGGHDEW